jgi:diaminopimelate decarboxylase
LERIQEYSENVSLVGIHCHLDSTFKEVAIFRDAAILMLEIVEQIRSEGFEL